jgi:hypothetical protein
MALRKARLPDCAERATWLRRDVRERGRIDRVVGFAGRATASRSE